MKTRSSTTRSMWLSASLPDAVLAAALRALLRPARLTINLRRADRHGCGRHRYSVEHVTDLAQTNTPSAWRCLEYLQLPASPYLWADKSCSGDREGGSTGRW